MIDSLFDEAGTRPEGPQLFSYEMSEADLQELVDGVQTVEESGFFTDEVIRNIRYVSFDSTHYYVITRGEHISTEKHHVEKSETTPKGWNVFKIEHRESLGDRREDYRGGCAGILANGIESTAHNVMLFPDERSQYSSEYPPASLMTVQIPAPTPYNSIHRGEYDVLCDLLFHEAAHRQQERCIDWKPGVQNRYFRSEEEYEKFKRVVEASNKLTENDRKLLFEHIRGGLQEMYALMISREAKKRYNPSLYAQESTTIEGLFDTERNRDVEARSIFEVSHFSGYVLVSILEDTYPDFSERKMFVESLMGPSHESASHM